VLGIAAIGATFVIISAGIDLSVGSTIGAAGIAASAVMLHAHSIALGIAAGIGAGFLTGSTLGLLIAFFELTPFRRHARRHVLRIWTDRLPHERQHARTAAVLARQSRLSEGARIPAAAIITVALFVLAQLALTRTTWGRRVQLLGANSETARISASTSDS